MNKQNFNQLGGFPLETDTLDKMQTAYELFNALGEIAGNYAIIKGCVVTGSTVSDGVVYLNGEAFKFVGGNLQATVRIIAVESSKQFENGNSNVVHYERYITFASGVDSFEWSLFKRIDSVLAIMQSLLERATIAETVTGLNDVKVSTPAGVKAAIDAAIDGMVVSLRKSTFTIGNPETDQDYIIPFPTVGTANYMVVGSLESFAANGNIDNDVIWVVRELQATSFKLSVREVSDSAQNLKFKYMLIKF